MGTALSAQKAQLRHDYFGHLSRMAFSIVVFPCLQPAVDEHQFALCNVLTRNLTEPVPTDFDSTWPLVAGSNPPFRTISSFAFHSRCP